MKDLITLSTKNVSFTFNNNTYQQKGGVATGSFFRTCSRMNYHG